MRAVFQWGRSACIWLILSVAAVAAPTFEEANALYAEGKFIAAKKTYEELAASGVSTANLFYNLGNAEFRLGALGRAALDYERALALEPGHHEAQTNLALARRQSGARLLPANWMEVALLPWSSRTYTILAAAAFWVLVFLLARQVFGRSLTTSSWVVAGLLILVAAYSALGLWRDWQRQGLAIIVLKEATARVDAADRTAQVEQLPAGSAVRVRKARDAWIYCDLPGRGRGWLPQTALERVRPESAS